MKERTRTYTPGTKDGKDCPCEEGMTDKQYCNTEIPCPTPGGWTEWAPWAGCSATCDGGINIRRRTCTNPKPANNEADCVGVAVDVQACKTDSCNGDETCGTNKEWTDKCTQELSCVDLTNQGSYKAEPCEPGCKCTPGYVDDGNGKCISPNDCSCYHSPTGKILYKGQVLIPDPEGEPCNECTCETNGQLKCSEKPGCDRDCGYTEWQPWGECTNLMGGVVKRFRGKNSPPALNNGKPCEDSKLVEELKCGDPKNCSVCTIGNRTYAFSQIISEVACEKKCWCGEDNKEKCESLEEVCATPCEKGYKRVKEPGNCCKCEQEEEKCQLETKSEKLTFRKKDGSNCTTQTTESLTYCKGSCPSMEGPGIKLVASGYDTFDKSCKCCAGVVADTREVVATCTDQTSVQVKYEVYSGCNCEVCTERTTQDVVK